MDSLVRTNNAAHAIAILDALVSLHAEGDLGAYFSVNACDIEPGMFMVQFDFLQFCKDGRAAGGGSYADCYIQYLRDNLSGMADGMKFMLIRQETR